MSDECRAAIGIVVLAAVLFLLFNPEILIGIVVYTTVVVLLVGGFAFCVGMMYLILKDIFK